MTKTQTILAGAALAALIAAGPALGQTPPRWTVLKQQPGTQVTCVPLGIVMPFPVIQGPEDVAAALRLSGREVNVVNVPRQDGSRFVDIQAILEGKLSNEIELYSNPADCEDTARWMWRAFQQLQRPKQQGR